MVYKEIYAVECLGLKDGRSQTYQLTATPTAAQTTDQDTLIEEAKSNLSSEGLAEPPYKGVTFKIRLIRRTEA